MKIAQMRGGRNVDDQNVDRPRISERRNGLFSWSERRKWVVDHYYENQNVEKNEKNIESLIFVWFSHFNYLWRMDFVNYWR